MGLYNWSLIFQRDPRNLNHSLGNMLILKILEAPTIFLEIALCDMKCIEGTISWMEEAWKQWLNYPYYSIWEQNKAIGNSVTLQFLIGRNNHNLCLVWIRQLESIYIKCYIIIQHKEYENSPGWCGSVDCMPAMSQRVTGSIPRQSTCLGFRPCP